MPRRLCPSCRPQARERETEALLIARDKSNRFRATLSFLRQVNDMKVAHAEERHKKEAQ
jgi:hypothetical protein